MFSGNDYINVIELISNNKRHSVNNLLAKLTTRHMQKIIRKQQ